MEIYAWFEFGLMTSYNGINTDFAKKAQQNNWI